MLIKLYAAVQSGLVVLVIIFYSHWSSKGGIKDICYENLWSEATNETCSLQFLCKPSAHCAFLSVTLLLARQPRSAPTKPALSCCMRLLVQPSNSPPFSIPCLQRLFRGVSHVFIPPLRSPVPPLTPRPSALILRMLRHSRWGIRSCDCGCCSPVSVTPLFRVFRPTVSITL